MPTTSAPDSSDGPPLGAKIKTSSPFRRRQSTVLVSIVTMPSIFGRNDSVTIAIFNYAVSLSKSAISGGHCHPIRLLFIFDSSREPMGAQMKKGRPEAPLVSRAVEQAVKI